MNRGIQNMLSMMHKCIMVKLGEVKKPKKNENMRENFINLAEIGGNMQYASLAWEMDGWYCANGATSHRQQGRN